MRIAIKKGDCAKVLGKVKFHLGIIGLGLARTIYGALVAGLIGLAVYAFIVTKSESGYVAVCNFIVACATLTVAMTNVYIMGCRKRGKKHERT